MINIANFYDALPTLLHGASISLKIALSGLVIGAIGGTLLALVSLYGNKLFKIMASLYVNIFRGTPMFVQMITLFYVLPTLGIMFSAYTTAIIAIGLNSIAYMSQVIKAGIQAVDRGQIQAAYTLGFSKAQVMRFIILPQAIRIVFPALTNECITLIKDSSLASVIGVAELTHEGSLMMSRTYDALTAYAGIAIIYLCMTSILTLFLYFLEKRFNHVVR